MSPSTRLRAASAIQLVRLVPEHVPDLARIAGDPRVAETTRLLRPYTETNATQFVEHARANWGKVFHHGIADATERLVGVIGLTEVDRQDAQAEVGYYVDPERWGEGIATEAVRLAVRFAQEQGIRRLTAHTLVRNAGSVRVLERHGFERLEVVPSPFVQWPPREPVARYALDTERRRPAPGAAV